MQYYIIKPPLHLTAYVRHFWVLEGELADGESYIHRCMADGCADLIFHYKGQFDKLTAKDNTEDCFLSGIQGQSQQHRRFMVSCNFGMLGVYLYPHALPRLFSVPADEVTNHMPDLATILGKEAAIWEDRIMLAGNNDERMKIVCSFLQQRLPRVEHNNAGIVKMINHIIDGNSNFNVQELARNHFLSIRQFERQFKVLAGYSPKLFMRIARFQSALGKYRNRSTSLTDIAYECGYYDQSHFIHDFKEFSGYHPMHYFTGKAEGITAQLM